jgi:hypothetical protein
MAVELPELVMPSFDGNPLSWRQFWLDFQRKVDSQPIDSVVKLAYLKGCLTGKALDAISGYKGGFAYPHALEVLKRHFGNEDLIKETLFREFLELPAVVDTVESLSRFSDSLEQICIQLEELGVPEDSSMYLIAKGKLPNSALTWVISQEKALDNSWGLSSLRERLVELVSNSRSQHPPKNGNLIPHEGLEWLVKPQFRKLILFWR